MRPFRFQIIEVDDKKFHKAFVNLPWDLMEKDPQWVPPLKLTIEDILDPKHPFYQTSHMKKWVALSQGRLVGRIAAGVNQAHNDFHQEKCCFYGFFECIDNPEIAQALLTTAEHYGKSQGMDILRGPLNPSTNYECGILVEGFNDPPQLMMTYNPPYYMALMEKSGFKKSMDLLAFTLPTDSSIPKRILSISEKIAQSHGITWRPLSKAHWKREMEIMQDIYNAAWEKNWGFVPMSPAEFAHLAKNLKSICVEDLALFVEVKGKPAGFIVALPDYNQVFKRIPNGKLFPTGIFKLLTGTKKINRARIITLGIRREFRTLGLSTLLYTQIQQQFFKLKQYKEVEMSWILENNEHMIKPLRLMGARQYKTYRIYEKSLTP